MSHRLPIPLRLLTTRPGSSTIAVVVLALGTGLVTAMFSAMNTVLWRPLPYAEPATLVALHETTSTGARTGVALPTLDDWRSRARSFVASAGYVSRTYLAGGAVRAHGTAAVRRGGRPLEGNHHHHAPLTPRANDGHKGHPVLVGWLARGAHH